MVALTSLAGITVREMDWKALPQDRKPSLDPLAARIPFDQHALFFSSFQAMSRWIDEADAYSRWRDGYQQTWSQVFDPIAVRFSMDSDRLSAEISVIPLIAGSEYRQLINLSAGARIAPNAGDRHPESLLHLARASNLPILNEWKRRYPAQDPVKLHEQFWHTTLVCPGGGRYVWNQQWQTMESTVYGHPAQPKPGPDKVLPFPMWPARTSA
jgi:hypothetical protein